VLCFKLGWQNDRPSPYILQRFSNCGTCGNANLGSHVKATRCAQAVGPQVEGAQNLALLRRAGSFFVSLLSDTLVLAADHTAIRLPIHYTSKLLFITTSR